MPASDTQQQVRRGGGEAPDVCSAVVWLHARAAAPAAPVADHPGAPQPAPSVGTAMVAGGVVRHTETVQVTTRQTIVDPHTDGDRGTVYGGSGNVYGGARSAEPGPAPAPHEESWTEQRLRAKLTHGTRHREVREQARPEGAAWGDARRAGDSHAGFAAGG